jgi:hypothetical protein
MVLCAGLRYSNVTFHIGDISKLEDVSNAIKKVSGGRITR